jgi:hypothetical protein
MRNGWFAIPGKKQRTIRERGFRIAPFSVAAATEDMGTSMCLGKRWFEQRFTTGFQTEDCGVTP